MQGHIINDWTKFNYRDPGDRQKLLGALQYFCALPERFVPLRYAKTQEFVKANNTIRSMMYKAQEFGQPSDFPSSVLAVLEKYHLTNVYDNGYESIFDIRDFSGSARNGFEIITVESGLTFKKIPIGGKVDVYQMKGGRETVYFDWYGAALGWHRQLFDDKEFWTLEDNAIEFRNKAYSKRAAIFYALIEAVGAGQNVAWQAPDPAALANTDPTYTANRDAQTLNVAAQTIIGNCLNKGYGVTPGSTFIVLTPYQSVQRVRRALALNLQSFSGSERQIAYNFQILSTTMLLNSSVYPYVILPKNKLKGGYRLDLEILSDMDILSMTETSAGWMRYGGAIGDTQQIQRCLFG